MRYYVLEIGRYNGKVKLNPFFLKDHPIGWSPCSIEECQKEVEISDRQLPERKPFIVDEEQYNRWWREYLDSHQ